MKILVVRVFRAAVMAGNSRLASIAAGISLFVGIERNDTERIASDMASRVVNMRIFENEKGKLHYSVQEKGYEILCIPNFTMCAHTSRGRRPSFDAAMEPEAAAKLFKHFLHLLSSYGISVQSGVFGKHMDIELCLDGPVNIVIESG